MYFDSIICSNEYIRDKETLMNNDYKYLKHIYRVIIDKKLNIIEVYVKDELSDDVETFSEEVIDQSNKFINGYELLKFKDGRFGYRRQSDHKILPYRYDVASDFNEYGLAMVAKRGTTSWINQNFEFFGSNFWGDSYAVFKKEDEHVSFNGYDAVFNFSKGEEQLSRLAFINSYNTHKIPTFDEYKMVTYLGIDGKIKQFTRYNSVYDEFEEPVTTFKNGNNFNRDGYAVDNNKILCSNGTYCTSEDIFDIIKKHRYYKKIFMELEKKEENMIRKLKIN